MLVDVMARINEFEPIRELTGFTDWLYNAVSTMVGLDGIAYQNGNGSSAKPWNCVRKVIAKRTHLISRLSLHHYRAGCKLTWKWDTCCIHEANTVTSM